MQRLDEKKDAEAVIAAALDGITELDDWQRVFLARSISSAFQGLYGLARSDAAKAVAPPEERRPFAKVDVDAEVATLSLDDMQKMLGKLRTSPVRKHRYFGAS